MSSWAKGSGKRNIYGSHNFSSQASHYPSWFKAVSDAVVSVDAKLQVGGPASSDCWGGDSEVAGHTDPNGPKCYGGHPKPTVDELLAGPSRNWALAIVEWSAAQTPPVRVDFTSTHNYPSRCGNATSFYLHLKQFDQVIARSTRPRTQRIITEWSSNPQPAGVACKDNYAAGSPSVENYHDTAAQASFAAKAAYLVDGLFTLLSHWAFSDVFEEQGWTWDVFNGGFGLVSRFGVRKPVFNAFKLLNEAGSVRHRVAAAQPMAPGGEGVVVFASSTSSHLHIIAVNHETPHCTVTVNIKGAHAQGELDLGSATIARIDDVNSNAYTAWRRLGEPRADNVTHKLDPAVLSQLHAAAAIVEVPFAASEQMTLHFELPHHGIARVQIPIKTDDRPESRSGCPRAGVALPGFAVEGAKSALYTLALPTLDACKSSCNSSHWCRAVVFKGLGVSGNPACGSANETCCYRLSTCTSSRGGLPSAWTSYVFTGPRPPPPPLRCSSAADCSLAGDCTAAGRCICAAGWTGKRCAALNLEPSAAAAYTPAPGLEQRTNTWCGSIIEDVATGVWHGFFTTMLHNCPVVDAFYQNGQVMHATAASPLGPFENATVAVPNWATQPEISYDPSTNTYVLLHSRYDSMSARTRGNMSALSCTVDGRYSPPPIGFDCARRNASFQPCPESKFPSGKLMEANVTLAFSKSLDGPWTTDRIDVALDDYMGNPSMMIHANGTAILIWRGSKGFATAHKSDDEGDRFEPGFHAHVPSGATADTNSPLYFNGWYHLFSQYRPGASGHPHLWYHWASRDLLGWAQLGAALSPNRFDCGAVWSGSATVVPDPAAPDATIPVLTAAMPCQTGITIARPVNASDPALQQWDQGMLLESDAKRVGTVADPSSGWLGADGDWRMLVALNRSSVGQYKSKRGFIGGNWTFAGKLAPGFASECPDFYRLQGTDTYVISGGKLGMYWRLGMYSERAGLTAVDSFEMLPGQLPFPNRSKLFEYDVGNFGAPKTFNDTSIAGDRRVLFGATGAPPCKRSKWAGLQTLPRVVTPDSGDGMPGIRTFPIPELNKLRANSTSLSAVKVSAHSSVTLPKSCWGAMLDLELELPVIAGLNLTVMVLAPPRPAGGLTSGVPVNIRTSNAGVPNLDGVPFKLSAVEKTLQLRIVVDVLTVEAFAQGGRRAATTVYCTPQAADAAVVLVNHGSADVEVSSVNVSQMLRARIEITGSTLKTDDALDDDFHCQSHNDCSLNGLCGTKNLGKCDCDKPWTGAQCGELRFKPMTAAGSDLYTASKLNNSWGGTLVAGLDGKFISFVSVYPPDSLWGNNCSIGVADNIEGPYVYTRSFDTSGGHLITVPYEKDGTKRFTLFSNPYHIFDFSLAEPTEFKMLSASKAAGPAVTINTQGKYFALGPGNRIMTASSFSGPWSTYSNYTGCSASFGSNITAEDVFFWVDRRGNFHELWHVYDIHDPADSCNRSVVSGHCFSLPDGKEFITKRIQPYGHEFKKEDGTSKIYATLERPTPQFNSDGVMTHITFAADLISGDAGCPEAKMCTQPGYPHGCCPKVSVSPTGKSVCACCNCKYLNKAGTILLELKTDDVNNVKSDDSPSATTWTSDDTRLCPAGSNASCWSDDYSCADCCTTGSNSAGAACWSGAYTEQRCCSTAATSALPAWKQLPKKWCTTSNRYSTKYPTAAAAEVACAALGPGSCAGVYDNFCHGKVFYACKTGVFSTSKSSCVYVPPPSVCLKGSAGPTTLTSLAQCVNCTAGRFAAAGATACKDCSRCKTSSQGAGSCDISSSAKDCVYQCDDKRFCDSDGSGCTTLCATHTPNAVVYSNANQLRGKFGAEANEICKSFGGDAHKICSVCGAAVCRSVCRVGTAGSRTLVSSAQCTRCTAGRFAPVGATACLACPCGTKPSIDAGVCIKIAGGCPCGSKLTSAADCAALLDMKQAAPCLAKVAPKDFCGWSPAAPIQFIGCDGGRVVKIQLKNCSIVTVPASIGTLTALTSLNINNNKLASCPSKLILAIAGGVITGSTCGRCPPLACIPPADHSTTGWTLSGKQTTCLQLGASYCKGTTGAMFRAACATTCGYCTPCVGLGLASDCVALLELQKAAPARLGMVKPQDLCGWKGQRGRAILQFITCYRGRVSKIYLQYSGLVSLPASIGDLTGLQALYLTNNQLTSVPAAIGNLKKLSYLDLRDNKVTSLPASIGDMNQLVYLYLSSNRISSVPISIGNLPVLTGLYLNNNQLTSVPASIGKLKTLIGLDLSDNQLTSIPASIGKLRALTQLGLKDNFLKSIPAALGDLGLNPNFFSFHLDGNVMQDVPVSFSKLTHLAYFTAARNQFGELTNTRIATILAGMGAAKMNRPGYPQGGQMGQFNLPFNVLDANVRAPPAAPRLFAVC